MSEAFFDAPPPQKVKEEAPSSPSSPLGLLLVLPALFLCFYIQFMPMLQILSMSTSDTDILRDQSESVGAENFNRLAEDELFSQAFGYSFFIVSVRVLIVAIVPILVGMLVGGQRNGGRWFNRVLLAIIAVFLSPVILANLWSLFFSQIWGREPSPLWPLPESILLMSPGGARNNILLLDALITIGIAAAVGGTALIAVMRGREVSPSTGRAGIGVWLLGILLTAMTLPQTFELPFILTNGGPARSTTTLSLMHYDVSFRMFDLGYGAAIAVILLIPVLFFGFLAWAVIAGFRLRIAPVPTPKPSESAGLLSILSVPMLILIALPLAGLVLWGWWLASRYGGFEALGEVLPIGRALANSFSSWMVIWLVQIPIAYLAGLGLGFFRPFNRVISEIVFMLLLVMAFIPAEVLMLRWFMMAREMSILNSGLAVAFGSLTGPISLIIFKMFFEGARDTYQAARNSGQTPSDAFTNRVFLPSLLIVVLVGVILSYISTQSVLWPLIVVQERELMTVPVNLVMIRSQFATDQSLVAGAAVSFAGIVTLVFLPLFILLHIFVLDRLAILAGPSVETDGLVEPPKRKLAPVPPASDDLWA
jgi:multiple sugar transport system permease protein